MKTRRAIAVAAAMTAVSASAVGVGFAAWNAQPIGSASSKADSLSAPTLGTPTNVTSSAAQINWAAPGGWQNAATYTATATSAGHTSGNCSAAASVGNCTISGVDASTAYSVTVVATAGTSWTSGASSTNFTTTAPPLGVSSIALTAGSGQGNASGQIDSGDKVAITFSAPVKPSTICSGFSDAANTASTINGNGAITVSVANNGATSGNDELRVSGLASSCSSGMHVGKIDLGSTGWLTADKSYFGNGSNATVASIDASHKVLTIILGGNQMHSSQVTGSVTAVYTPDTSITDTSGTTVSGTGSTTGQQF